MSLSACKPQQEGCILLCVRVFVCVRVVDRKESGTIAVHNVSGLEPSGVFTRLHPQRLRDEAASPGFCRATWHKRGKETRRERAERRTRDGECEEKFRGGGEEGD